MGADGFIRDPAQPLGFGADCYICGERITPGEIPLERHDHKGSERYAGTYPICEFNREDADSSDNWKGR